MNIRIITLVLLFTTTIWTQPYINSFPKIGIQERYSSNLLFAGIGNMGFDNLDGFYNPKFVDQKEKIIISVSGNLYINSVKSFSSMNFSNSSTNKFLPNFQISFLTNNILFQLHIMNTNYLNQSYKSDEDLFVEFTHAHGASILGYNDIIYSTQNYNIQFDASLRIEKALSISAGLSTNLYNQKINVLREFEPFSTKIITTDNLLKNIHFISSLNYSLNNLKAYVYFKSNISKNLDSDEIRIHGSSFRINSVIDHPGILAFGIQHKIYEQIKLSLEYNQELSANLNTEYKYIIPGINFNWNNIIELGAMYAHNTQSNPDLIFGNRALSSDTGKTYYYIISMLYRINNATITIDYQYFNSGRDSKFSKPFENYYYDSISVKFINLGVSFLI